MQCASFDEINKIEFREEKNQKRMARQSKTKYLHHEPLSEYDPNAKLKSKEIVKYLSKAAEENNHEV